MDGIAAFTFDILTAFALAALFVFFGGVGRGVAPGAASVLDRALPPKKTHRAHSPTTETTINFTAFFIVIVIKTPMPWNVNEFRTRDTFLSCVEKAFKR